MLALGIGVGLAGCAAAAIVLADSASAAPLRQAPDAAGNTHIVATATSRPSPTTVHSTVTGATVPKSAAGAAQPGPTTPQSHSAAPAPAPTATRPAAQSGLPLTAAQLPDSGKEIWQPVGTPVVRSISGHDISINECAKVIGAQTWSQQGYGSAATQDPAIQDAYTFASPDAARSAYTALVDAMNSCGKLSTALQSKNGIAPDAVVRETAAQSDASAWERTWNGVEGMSAAGPQVDHYYVALRGGTVLSLQFAELTSPGKAAYPVAGDNSVLTMLETEPIG
jgi:hypothetical protein